MHLWFDVSRVYLLYNVAINQPCSGGSHEHNPSIASQNPLRLKGFTLIWLGQTASVLATAMGLETVQPETPPVDIVHLGMPWSDFSLRFDPHLWEITAFRQDQPELQSLTHQALSGGWTSLDGDTVLGQLTLHSKRFFENGELRFVVYSGFLGSPMEGAVEVHFAFDGQACLQAAEALFTSTEVILP